MKNQAIFSSKDKSKILKCPQLQFLFGALRVKPLSTSVIQVNHTRSSVLKFITPLHDKLNFPISLPINCMDTHSGVVTLPFSFLSSFSRD